MAKLQFNATGYLYQDGVRNLRKMFAGAAEGLDRHLREAYAEVDAFDRAAEQGGAAPIVTDETGWPVPEWRDVLIHQTVTAEEAKDTLNAAIALAAFHHWERSARGWTGRPHGRFTTLRDHVQALGYPVSPALEDVHLLANLLKHSNPEHGRELHRRRPDLFRRAVDPEAPTVEWSEEIRLTDEHVAEVFATLAASGPTVDHPGDLSGFAIEYADGVPPPP